MAPIGVVRGDVKSFFRITLFVQILSRLQAYKDSEIFQRLGLPPSLGEEFAKILFYPDSYKGKSLPLLTVEQDG